MAADKTWDAQSYSENSDLQYQASKIFFSTLALNGNETILDIGCGTGLLTSEIAEKVSQGKVIGIDSSESMIAFANQNYKSSNLEFILMRAEDLNFSFEFDVIVSSFCIHWINDKQKLFNRIAAHLKSNGSTRIIMPFRNKEIAKIRSTLMTNAKWEKYFDTKEAQDLLVFDTQYDVYAREAGLENLVYQIEEVTTHFADENKMKIFLKNVTSNINEL